MRRLVAVCSVLCLGVSAAGSSAAGPASVAARADREGWPDTRAGSREREGGRSQTYAVVLRGRRDYRLELPEGQWAALRAGQSLQGVIRGGREVLSIR